MATIPSSKFSTAKRKIASTKLPTAKRKLASGKLAGQSAKIPSRKMGKATRKKVAKTPVPLGHPTDEQSRQDAVEILKSRTEALKRGDEKKGITMDFDQLKTFIEKSMRMSHIYQPIMLMTLLVNGGKASVPSVVSSEKS